MKRQVISSVVVLAVLLMFLNAFGQDEGRARQREDLRDRFQNMSEAEREKFRAEMRGRRERWENMSEEERAEARAQIQRRFGAPRGPGLGREEQLETIKAIEGQLAKLKAAVEGMDTGDRSNYRDLSEEQRNKLREKMMASMRERQMAIREIEQQVAKLRSPGRPSPESRARIGELQTIHELAVKEKATETAKRIERLIARYQRESEGGAEAMVTRPRGDIPRPRRERPIRREGDQQRESGNRARPFTLNSFDGKTINLSDYRGRTVVLEWLNFECPFVKHHYDNANTMVELAKKYKSKNVVWLAINSTSHTEPAANVEFARKYKLPYSILDDRSGKVGLAYGAKTTPHVFIISPRGNIVYNGAIDNSPQGRTPAGEKMVNYVDKVLSELIAGKDISVGNTKPYGCSVKYAK